jgi:hypothetical protein
MERRVVEFRQDEARHWVAELECGHNRHLRHEPPGTVRPWVVTPEGSGSASGRALDCKKCDLDAPGDWS